MSQQSTSADLGAVLQTNANLAPVGSVPLPINATPDQKDHYIMANYGFMAWALAVPELKKILEGIVGPNGITVDQNAFDGMVRQTAWFKGTTQAMRSWVQMQGEDPATAAALLDKQSADLNREATTMGLHLDKATLSEMSMQSLAYQWDKPMMDQALYAETMRQTFKGTALGGVGGQTNSAGSITGSASDSTQAGGLVNGALRRITGNPFGGGTLADNYDKIMGLANQYMVTVSPTTASQWAIAQSTGELDPTAIEGNLISLAIGKFPTLKTQIEGGITPAQLFDPIKQEVAKTLEVGPDTIDWRDPKYQQLFQYAVPKGQPDGGTVRPMTITEAVNFARNQDQWNYTAQGQQAGASLAKSIGTQFGIMK